MISREQLIDIGKTTSLHLYQQEKDYLLKLFLSAYFRLFDDAVFKGGTCIKYVFGLDRFSEDLDFNLLVSPKEFESQVDRTLKEIHLIGIVNYFIKKELFEDAYTCVIGVQGPLYTGTEQTRNKFRIDAGKRTGTIKTPEWRLIPSEYPETRRHFLVRIMNEQEILVEKICSLFERQKGRDLYDVWFLLKKGVEIDAELLYKKKKTKTLSWDLPRQREYERDVEKLTNRIIPYSQVKKDVIQDLKEILSEKKQT